MFGLQNIDRGVGRLGFDELVSLDPHQRRTIAAALRSVSDTFTEVRMVGRTASHVLGVLAHLLDPA